MASNNLNLSECRCPICMYILIEPVTLPCEHELCMPCYKQHVEETSLLCPVCRRRLSVWARRAARLGSLVNQGRWLEIQECFPEKVRKRLEGEEDEDEDESPEVFVPPLAEPGELRKEYELEQSKVSEERRQQDLQEEEASRQLLLQLERQIHEQEARRREQEQEDLQFAAQLSKELNGVTPQINENDRPVVHLDIPATPVAPKNTGLINNQNKKRAPSGKSHQPSSLASTSTSRSGSSQGSSQGHLKMWFQSKPKDSSGSGDTMSVANRPGEGNDNQGCSSLHGFSQRRRAHSEVSHRDTDPEPGPSQTSRERSKSGNVLRLDRGDSKHVNSPRKRLCLQNVGNSSCH